jgi:hypothetical protein
MSRLFAKLRSVFARRNPSRPARRVWRPQIERLEDRLVLAGEQILLNGFGSPSMQEGAATYVKSGTTLLNAVAIFSAYDKTGKFVAVPTGYRAYVSDYGDGSGKKEFAPVEDTQPQTGIVRIKHVYEDVGTYYLTIKIISPTGFSVTKARVQNVGVTQAPLELQPNTVYAVKGYRESYYLGSFVSGNKFDRLNEFTIAAIDWGDGTPRETNQNAQILARGNGRFDLYGRHTYTSTSPRLIGWSIQDDDVIHSTPYAFSTLVVTDAALQLSVELNDTAPAAANRLARVSQWLKSNAKLIVDEAKLRGIAPEAIAGAIAWEALFNVATFKTYQGPGKVHPISNAVGIPTAAEQVDNGTYLPQPDLFGSNSRFDRVQNTGWAIRYIAAIEGAYADAAKKAGSKADLANRPDILATFYNGVSVDTTQIPVRPTYNPNPLDHTTPILPNNAYTYFRSKIGQGDTYRAGPTMGSWVASHLRYLHVSLGLP